MADEDLRVVAVALAALAVVWPQMKSARLFIFTISGLLVVISTWSATFSNRNLDWAIVVVVLMAVALGWAVTVLYEVFTTPTLTWVLFASCLGAVYVCVPENDQINEIGLLYISAGVIELLTRQRLPMPVWSAASMALLWAAVYGASGQSRAVIGGLFAVSPIIAVAAFGRRAGSLNGTRVAFRRLIVAIWAIAAWVVARTGGIAQTASAAWVAVAIATLLGVVLSVVIQRAYKDKVKA